MERLIVRWVLSAVSIAIVARFVPGIDIGSGSQAVVTVIVAAGILGLANALVKPVVTLLSCPLVVLTLGLFLLVINAAMLMLTSRLAEALHYPFVVRSWGSAVVGSILISIVSWFLSLFVGKHER